MDFRNITIGDLIDEISDLFPDNDALVYPDRDIRLSYRQFQQKCNQAAKAFIGLGVKSGEKVAIWANNIPEWVITQFSTAKMGAVLVTVNTNYRAFELEYLLKQSDTGTFLLIEGIKGSEYLDIIYELCPELNHCEPGKLESEKFPFLKNIIYIGEGKKPGMLSWDEFIATSDLIADQELVSCQKALKPDDVINMQYTSGTTGYPKGVMLSHTNIVGNARSQAECMDFNEKDRLCIPVPFFHCFGCVMGTLICLVSGATMVPVVAFKAKTVLETIEKESCTAVHG
ncbi:MAG: AMP-binding protein, partial [Peptococcaceae bacterium]|nr:AMP-binding protein [Peptococcaceae bacterium]